MNEDLKTILNEVYAHYDYKYGKAISEILEENERLQQRIDKAIEVLKLCNSKCSKEVMGILGGNNE